MKNYNWNDPVNMWGGAQVRDYITWVKEAYGMKEAKKLFKYVRQYRAIKDLKASVQEETNNSVQSILEHGLGTIFKEAYQDHATHLALHEAFKK